MTSTTPISHHSVSLPLATARPVGSRWRWSFLIDIAVMLFLFAAVFGIYAIGRSWLGPVAHGARISQNPRALPLYALYSLVRIGVAYGLSLIFALGYGYLAANSRRAEIILIPLLDILQSIPVLSFLPGVMLAMVAFIPTPANRSGAWFCSPDFYRAGLEYCFQFLLFAQNPAA